MKTEERQDTRYTPEQAAEMTAIQKQEVFRDRLKLVYKMKPEVILELQDQIVTLEFTNESAEGIMFDTGVNLLEQPFGPHINNPTFLNSALYWGLRKHHPELAPECETVKELKAARAAVGRMWSVRHRLTVTARVAEALSLFMPDMSDIVLPEKPAEETEEKPKDPIKLLRTVGSDTSPQHEDADFLGETSTAQATP